MSIRVVILIYHAYYLCALSGLSCNTTELKMPTILCHNILHTIIVYYNILYSLLLTGGLKTARPFVSHFGLFRFLGLQATFENSK